MQRLKLVAPILFLLISVKSVGAQSNGQTWEEFRDFGIAYYEEGNYARAVGKLAEAFRNRAKDALTGLYLGLSYEGNAEHYKAGIIYRYLATLDLPDKIEKEMQSRHFASNRKHWRDEIQTNYHEKKAIFKPKPNAIAVLYFRNISDWSELQPVIKGFTELLNHDLGKIKLLDVSPRGKVQSLYDVSNFSSEQLYDKIKATDIGKILNVSYLITGGIERLTDTHIKISAGAVNTKTGYLVGDGALAEGQLSDIIELEKEIVTELIYDLSITLHKSEQKTITTKLTDESLAFIAFSKGLDSEDKGDFGAAKRYYKKALKEDKAFREAKERSKLLPENRYSNSELIHIFSTELN